MSDNSNVSLRDDLDEMPLASLAAYVGLDGHLHAPPPTEDTLISAPDTTVTDGPHKCAECDKEFVNRAGLAAHHDRVHVLDPSLASVIESDSTPQHHLGRDEMRHFDDEQVIDTHADAVVSGDNNNSRDHALAKDGDGDEAGHTPTDDDLFAILRTRRDDGRGGLADDDRRVVATVTCPECASTGREPTEFTQADFTTHVATHHQQTTSRPTPTPPHVPVICDHCQMSVASADALASHIRLVHKPVGEYTCDQCDKTFTGRTAVNGHKRLVHRTETKFQCTTCGRSFGTKGNLVRHVNSIHIQKQTFPCSQCNRTFTQAGDLSRHLSVVHDRRKDYACDSCGKQFGYQRDLKRHISAIHFKNKYGCQVCGGMFTEKSHLSRHTRRYHTPKQQDDEGVGRSASNVGTPDQGGGGGAYR